MRYYFNILDESKRFVSSEPFDLEGVTRGRVIIWRYVVKRLLQLIPILFDITLLSFALMQTASGDTVDVIMQQCGMKWDWISRLFYSIFNGSEKS